MMISLRFRFFPFPSVFIVLHNKYRLSVNRHSQAPKNMANSYGSIPQDPKKPRKDATAASSNKKLYIVLAVILIVGVAFFSGSHVPPHPPAEHWPPVILKIDSAFHMLPSFYPSSTTEITAELASANLVEMGLLTTLVEMGFAKTDDSCDPLLGEAWTFQGERSSKYASVFYFTPSVGDTPGVLSGVGADYYGHVDEKLIETGMFFSEEKPGTDGSYRSIAVALRNGEEENLCDTEAPVKPGNPAYLMVSPGKANILIPPTEDVEELKQAGFQAGSCLQLMGFHWEKFLEPQELPYKAGDLMPVVPMYSSTDGTLNGIFFTATDQKQTWPEECTPVNPQDPCAATRVNMWDYSAGLKEANKGRFFMCANFCGECSWTGTADGWFTTMHFMFKNTVPMPDNPDAEMCGAKTPQPQPPVCR